MINKYPYTDFQQLNLDWFLDEFKKLYDSWVQFKAETEQEIDDFETAMRNDFADLVDQFDDFKDYVNNYLNTLDFPGAVADVIAEMVNDGSFLNVMLPSINSEVTEWLNDHVTPTSPVVDDTLTIAGAAADAKTTGDKINERVPVKELSTETAFTDFLDFGIWHLSSEDVAAFTDKPADNFGGGTFINLPTGTHELSRMQILEDVVNNITYLRYRVYLGNGEYRTEPWVNFDFGDDYYTVKSLSSDTTLLSDNKDYGIYRVGSYTQAPFNTYTDRPRVYGTNGAYIEYGGGYMIVAPHGGTTARSQTLYDVTNNYIYQRTLSGSNLQTVGEWNVNSNINWCAVGDSITYGVISTSSTATTVNQGRAYLARIANYLRVHLLSNKGIRGLGFVHQGNNGETLKTSVIDATTWSDYNLVTVALGVNDYYGNMPLGSENSAAWDGTIYGNIKGTIENILTANPTLKLIFITPFNMAKYGSASTHWGRSYSRSNCGSLDDIKNAIIYCCDYYGIEYINETDYSPINDINIQALLLDGLHPSLNCHALIAKDLRNKINFR